VNKIKVHLGVIQETLLIPLWAKACELQAADPIIVDPKLSEMITAITYQVN
jgi:O-methyltransferase involved in polyketide biosynthesis